MRWLCCSPSWDKSDKEDGVSPIEASILPLDRELHTAKIPKTIIRTPKRLPSAMASFFLFFESTAQLWHALPLFWVVVTGFRMFFHPSAWQQFLWNLWQCFPAKIHRTPLRTNGQAVGHEDRNPPVFSFRRVLHRDSVHRQGGKKDAKDQCKCSHKDWLAAYQADSNASHLTENKTSKFQPETKQFVP